MVTPPMKPRLPELRFVASSGTAAPLSDSLPALESGPRPVSREGSTSKACMQTELAPPPPPMLGIGAALASTAVAAVPQAACEGSGTAPWLPAHGMEHVATSAHTREHNEFLEDVSWTLTPSATSARPVSSTTSASLAAFLATPSESLVPHAGRLLGELHTPPPLPSLAHGSGGCNPPRGGTLHRDVSSPASEERVWRSKASRGRGDSTSSRYDRLPSDESSEAVNAARPVGTLQRRASSAGPLAGSTKYFTAPPPRETFGVSPLSPADHQGATPDLEESSAEAARSGAGVRQRASRTLPEEGPDVAAFPLPPPAGKAVAAAQGPTRMYSGRIAMLEEQMKTLTSQVEAAQLSSSSKGLSTSLWRCPASQPLEPSPWLHHQQLAAPRVPWRMPTTYAVVSASKSGAAAPVQLRRSTSARAVVSTARTEGAGSARSLVTQVAPTHESAPPSIRTRTCSPCSFSHRRETYSPNFGGGSASMPPGAAARSTSMSADDLAAPSGTAKAAATGTPCLAAWAKAAAVAVMAPPRSSGSGATTASSAASTTARLSAASVPNAASGSAAHIPWFLEEVSTREKHPVKQQRLAAAESAAEKGTPRRVLWPPPLLLLPPPREGDAVSTGASFAAPPVQPAPAPPLRGCVGTQ